MNAAIELHDSWVVGIIPSGGSLLVRLGPAYLHRSEGHPGFDPGSVWVQDLELVFSEAVLESDFTELPRRLLDGSLSVGNDVLENCIPLPLDVRGVVRFSAVSLEGERLIIQGTRAMAVTVGEACYVEQFPGTK